MRQLDTARVEKKEAIQHSGWHLLCVQSRLHLLAENLTLLIAPILQLVVVLHFGLTFSDLDHVVQVGDFDRERLLLSIHQTFVSS